MSGCADMLIVPFLGFLWCHISIHGSRRKTASPQGSWERHWATFPTLGPGLGTLKGTDTHTSFLHLSLPLPSVSFCPSPSSTLETSSCTHGQSDCRRVFKFFPHEWLMSAKIPASSDRNLCWTLKHGFVYCFAYGFHKQSYSQLMFASSHLRIVNVSLSIMYINKYKTYGIFIETLSSILLGLSRVIIIACPAELHTQ